MRHPAIIAVLSTTLALNPLAADGILTNLAQRHPEQYRHLFLFQPKQGHHLQAMPALLFI